MPLRIVALEPERKVGSTVAAQAYRRSGYAHSCLAGDAPDLKFRVEGFQIRIEHRRRSQKLVYQLAYSKSVNWLLKFELLAVLKR